MQLYVGGTNHNDPLCRLLLKRWLKELCKDKNSLPTFIGVEANRTAYKRLLAQRDIFRETATKQLTSASATVIELLARTIYFEADAHVGILPHSRVVWLDKQAITNTVIENYARKRIKMYKPFFPCSDDVLWRISTWAWRSSDYRTPPTNEVGVPDPSRDYNLYDRVKKALFTTQGNWAIVIVGAKHAVNRQDSMRTLLESHDAVHCNTKILEPIYASHDHKIKADIALLSAKQ